MNKIKISIVLSVLFFFLINVSQAENRRTGTLYGKHHEFTVTAPKGWVIDNISGVPNGLHAVFYPEGGSWGKSEAVMYANGVQKDGEDIKQFIEGDVKSFKDRTKAIRDGAGLYTKDRKKAYVKYFLGETNGNYEAIAYINEKYVVAILCMVAKSERAFKDGYPAFKEFVGSYYFITDRLQDVEITAKTVFGIPAKILATAKKYSYSDNETFTEYEKAFGQNYGNELGGFLNECAEKTNKNLQDFTLVLKVEKDGSVSIIYADKHNKTTDCLVPKMVNAKLPPPPFSPYYELIETKITK